MPRLPQPGSDNGTWGTILNDYLSQTHTASGTLKDNTVGSAQLQDNAVTNSTIAPDTITATEIQDGTIQEAQLATPVQTKLNQAAPTWSTLSGKPAVVAAGVDAASARSAIGLDVIDGGTTTILPRTSTAAQWTSANPVLAMGEEGYETDTKRWKRGDGATAWTALAYYQPAWDEVTGKPPVVERTTISKTITVGVGGDYATLNAALAEASRYSREYLSKGLALIIRQLTGFVMAEQVFVVQQDLSFVTITSDDAEVTITRSALTEGNGGSTNNWRTGTFPAFCGMRGAKLPFIKTLYSMDSSGDGTGTVGVYVFENSQAVISRNCGVKNAGWRGLYVDGAIAYARQTIWDGSGHAGGPEGVSGGVRGSNGAVVMVRDASMKNCACGAYFSDSTANVSDADFSTAGIGSSTSMGIGLGVHANSVVYGGGVIADNCERYNIYVTDGGRCYIGESSKVSGSYLHATGAGISAVYVDDCGTLGCPRATLSSVGGHAVSIAGNSSASLEAASVTASAGRGISIGEGSQVHAQSATISATGDWGVRLFNGSLLNATDAKIGGTSGGVQLNGGSQLISSGAKGLDGVASLVCNVRAGEHSVNGVVFGADERALYRSDDSSMNLNSSTEELLVLTANFTSGRSFNLYDSISAGGKRHTIVHAGSGSTASVFAPGGTVRLASLSIGEAVTVVPDGIGGWAVSSRSRKAYAGRTVGGSNVSLTPASQFIRESGQINSSPLITMYSASDGAARDHTFTRTDDGTGVWSVYEPGGTTLITTVAAGQWAQIAPKSDGTAWYLVARGLLTV
ncbi:MAG: hypothetical protein WAW80_01155 [Candidatus Saccharimonadales bacterium]